MSSTDLLEFDLKQTFRLADIRNNALNDMIRTAYRRHFQKCIADKQPLPLVLQKAVAEIGEECFTKPKVEKNTKWFITISAKDPVDHCSFWRQMEKCIKKKQLQGKGEYVLEQRSQGDESPYGWHIHWRVEFDSYVSKGIIVQQVAQCFKCYLAGDNYVDVRLWNSSQPEYIRGTKDSPDKMLKVAKDKILRNKYAILDLISY